MAASLGQVGRYIRDLPRRSLLTAKTALADEPFVMRWPHRGTASTNWGDKLNPWLAEKITGRRPVHGSDLYPLRSYPVHYWIGSHLGAACADPRSVVWGAGFIDENAPIVRKDADLRAVRGWRSVEKLRKAGAFAPDVVGDTALLLPRFHMPATPARRYSLGVIPHFRDRDEPFFAATRQWDDVLVIDITGGIEEVIDQIASCDAIASSSLHGIICADAYGVPAYWLESSAHLLGDGFKFNDYFSSVSRPEQAPFAVTAETTRKQLEDHFFDYRVAIDLDALWRACPAGPAA